uniref:Transmembrane protein 275 n=1 Tax=Oryzias latipes TaxID=8090 RepID=A0A3P9KRZ1_ORYLA
MLTQRMFEDRGPGSEAMIITERNNGTPVPEKGSQKKKKKSRPHGLPSPALCCACGLCIMLAGLNITLVGAFAFTTLVPSANPPIIIGPVLLLVAFSFFGACCVCSRLPPPHSSRGSNVNSRGTGLIGRSGLAGGAAFEIETSEHTLQDTTAVQLSPTSSPGSSRASSPDIEAPEVAQPGPCKPFSTETNGPACVSAAFSASGAGDGEVRLCLPREEVVT